MSQTELFKIPEHKPLRCISLWQPWASLMACGAKFLETREWNTRIRGRIGIHASQTTHGIRDVLAMRSTPKGIRTIKAMEAALGLEIADWLKMLAFGKLVAAGALVETHAADTALRRWPQQQPFGNFGPGRFAHEYRDLVPFDPIPMRGSQGFFFAPEFAAQIVRAKLYAIPPPRQAP
jgi:hypothetical protein